MLVADKKYSYDYYDYLNGNEEKNIKKNKKRNKKKNNLFLKISVMFWVVVISAALIFVLLRYTEITQAEYSVHSLNVEITQLENQLQDLKVEFDSLTRSDIIEDTAVEKLSMQYPQYEQMVFLNIENKTNSDLTVIEEYNAENGQRFEGQNDDKKLFDYFRTSIQKLYSLLD